ncbi:hypothetical protein PoMZ_03956 [Pyricularia oryzae]|uniref:Uncharacterized protein n=1 Tax=Pyricularia oryzae TaxID=318829 RepID=A0A4P7NCC4_PYROR|nr:hypothetical protein PoMZ_03956 [Pyricularia oryzae]
MLRLSTLSYCLIQFYLHYLRCFFPFSSRCIHPSLSIWTFFVSSFWIGYHFPRLVDCPLQGNRPLQATTQFSLTRFVWFGRFLGLN